jgi:hypothetical protein
MKEYRSLSQILYGYLPDQTVDLQGGVWKVRDWRRPLRQTAVDMATLRAALCRQAAPWQATGKDGGMVADLHRGCDVWVYTLDRTNGVEVEPFPKLWMCKRCQRLRDTPHGACKCGSTAWPGQLPFVAYHDACGAIRTPWIPRCKQHDDVKVVFPGTASATEIQFVCPECGTLLRKGFGFPKCDCGQGRLTFNVHRAASVYSQRSVVIVNPPSRDKIEAIVQAGGPSRALSWVVGGMTSRTIEEVGTTRESLRRQLSKDLPAAAVESMIAAAEAAGAFAAPDTELSLPAHRVADAEEQAVTIALSVSEARLRISDVCDATPPESALGRLYRSDYPQALETAGLAAVDLIDRFPVLAGNFGYTRGDSTPGASRLVPFRHRNGAYLIYAELADTEALFVRLQPTRVADWLRRRGFALRPWDSDREARISILEAVSIPPPGAPADPADPGHALLTLVHSYAHRFIRLAAVYAGIDRNALSELLVPLHLGFYVYAASSGDFVLGGLQAVFESDLHNLLTAVVHDEHRCPLDPGCLHSGGACMACLHLGEPSCRYYNRFLDRGTLHGIGGYLVPDA